MRVFVPLDMQCFWCNGRMRRGTAYSGSVIEHVTYFCKDCGAVAHFAVNHKKRIDLIEVEYKTTQKGEKEDATD